MAFTNLTVSISLNILSLPSDASAASAAAVCEELLLERRCRDDGDRGCTREVLNRDPCLLLWRRHCPQCAQRRMSIDFAGMRAWLHWLRLLRSLVSRPFLSCSRCCWG